MKTFNILPKARWLVTITLLLSLCIPHAWAGVRSGWTRVTSVAEITAGGTFIVGWENSANSNTVVPMINKPSTLTGTTGNNATSYLYSGTANASNNTTIDMSDKGSGATTNYEFEFVAGSSSGTIAIKLSDNTYVGFYGSSNNNCRRYASVGTNASFTPTISSGIVTLTNVQYNSRKLSFNNNSGSYRFSNYSSSAKIVLYKKSSSCSNSVGVTTGSESHGEVTTIGSASVATCSSTASDRQVTITVTPDDCYDAPSTLTWTKSSGTVTASKQRGPTDNGDGTYSYVYQFAQNDNGAGTFGVTCTAKAAGKTVNFDAGPGVSASSSLTETCDGSGVTLPSVTATGVCKGWTTFAGWATAPVTDSTTTSGVTLYAAGSNYVPASNNMTLYAVYSKVKGGGSSTLTIYPSTYTNKGTNNYGSGAERTGTVGTINLGAHYVTGNASGTPGGSSAGDFLQCQGSNANIYNKTALPGKITQVVLNQNSATAFSLYCGTEQLMASNNTSTGQTPSGTAQTAQSAATQMTWTVSGNYTYFDLKKGSSAGYVSSIVVTYSSSATYYCSDPNCASCSADPSAGTASLNGSFSLTSVGVQATSASSGANCTYSDYGFLWSETISEAASLKLNESTGAAPSGATKVPVGNSGNVTSFTGALEKSSFEVGHTYYYRSYAHNNKDAGTYQYSSVVSFTPRSVTFNLNGHGTSTPSTQYVNNGGKATDPSYSESVAGWTFGGWYDNEGCTGSAWNFSSNTVSGANVTLYAKWTEKPKYTITLNAGNGSVSASGWTAGVSPTWSKTQANGDEEIALPSASCNCAGWEFQGWAASSVDQAAAPTMTNSGTNVLPASNTTYYAVYRQNTPSGDNYTKITTTGELTTGYYVITGLFSGSSPYAMKGELYNEGVSLAETSQSVSTNVATQTTAAFVWQILNFGSYVAFKNKDTGKFLAIVDGKFALQDDGQKFTYSVSSGAWTFTSPSGKQIIYASRFNVGDAQNQAIHLFRQNPNPSGNYKTSPSCSDYTITGEANPAAGGSVQLTAAAAKNGDKVWACYTADPEYNFVNWTKTGTGASLSSTSAQFTEITVGTSDVTVTANFAAKVMYDITWKAHGETLTGGDLGSASVRVENGHNITTLPPAPTSCETGSGKSENFIGWVVDAQNWSGKTNDLTGITIYKKASEFPAVSGNVTYHAVWAATDETTNEWVKVTDVDDLKDGETVAFISAGEAYYLPNAESDPAPAVAAVTKTGDDINFVNAMKFTATYNSTYGGFTFESVSATGKYLWAYNDNKGIYISATDGSKTGASDIWYLEDFDEANSASTGYGIGMYATTGAGNYRYLTTYGTTDWRSYKSTSVGTGTPANILANIYRYAAGYKDYMTKCCTTPTLAFAASPYATIRQDIHGASSSTWAEVDVTFTSNSSGTISATTYTDGKTVYKLSSWEGRGTTSGTLCAADHAYFEVLSQPSGETPGTGKFHVKTTTGQTGQGTYRIAITQAATDAEHGNYCEATVYGFVDVTLRDKFVDNVNDNEGPVNKDGHGAQVATPALSEFGTQVENACHSEGRKLKGWIKETDLQTLYESGTPASTRVQTIDGLCESCSAGSDQTSLIKAPGANITTSGATWYAVWAYEK